MTAGCVGAPQTTPAKELEVPAALSPPDGSTLHTLPRRLEMQWSPVPGAAGYGVQVDYFEPGGWNSTRAGSKSGVYFVPDMSAPSYTTEFPDAQFGRWRVWAVDAKGRPGAMSPWLKFSWDARPRIQAPNGVTPPRSVYAPNPVYPPSAARDKIAGQVLVTLTVGVDGLVSNAVVVRPVRRDLDDAALQAVKSWRFEPALRGGQPVEGSITVELGFYVQ